MTDAITIALSGLLAQKQRVAVSANNIANVSTAGPVPVDGVEPAEGDPQVFRPREVVQSSLIVGGEGAGTLVATQEKQDGFSQVFQPDSIFANADGFVAVPNVDLAEEAVNLMLAKNAFKANLAAIRTASEMESELLDELI